MEQYQKAKESGSVKHHMLGNLKGSALSSSQKRQHQMVVNMRNPNYVMSKSDMDFVKNTINRMANPRDRRLDPPVVKALINASWAQEDGIKLESGFQTQGFDLLKKKKNKLGYREEEILEDAKEIRLNGFHDNGNMHVVFYVPNFKVVANDGSTMEYHVENGDISITG